MQYRAKTPLVNDDITHSELAIFIVYEYLIQLVGYTGCKCKLIFVKKVSTLFITNECTTDYVATKPSIS